MSKKQHIIRLDRDVEDRILPEGFFNIIVHRFLPVLSLSYIVSIIAISISKGAFIYYMFQDSTAYTMGLLIVLWISGPGLVWVLLHGSPLFHHVADLWYKILAGLMIITIALSYILFPEADVYGLRIYFILSVPAFVLIYFLFVKDILPKVASYPLNAMGFCALLYGAVVNIIF
ncbi:MAG: hypothetical protein COA45_01065 [Zetaproteobacteria bacterium]|nr:MAG: hypothetical protein COA45_01065 [Zetaproteobacteria bacterium]